jgi:hypothetical protein
MFISSCQFHFSKTDEDMQMEILGEQSDVVLKKISDLTSFYTYLPAHRFSKII